MRSFSRAIVLTSRRCTIVTTLGRRLTLHTYIPPGCADLGDRQTKSLGISPIKKHGMMKQAGTEQGPSARKIA